MADTDPAALLKELAGFGELYAPFIIGMMIGCFLFGITMSQAIIYLRRYKDDKLMVRGVVWASLIMDTFHFVMVAEVVHFWYLYCRRPEKYLGLLEFHWSLGASVIATYLITSAVQALYIMRVWMLSGSKKLVYVLGFLSVTQLAFGFVLWGDLTIAKSLAAVHAKMGQIGGSIELAATSLCDIAISASLWYYLHRNRSGFAKTETVVKKLIQYTVNIGILTSGASSLTLILWLALPQNFGFISLTLIRSKLYVNSLLVTLNYRKTAQAMLRRGQATGGSTSRYFQDLDTDYTRADVQLQSFGKGSHGALDTKSSTTV